MAITVGILGATGYTGAELTRLLLGHCEAEIAWLTSEKFKAQRVSEVFPGLAGFCGMRYTSIADLGKLASCDLVFSCLPNGQSMHFVAKCLGSGSRVIDLSADFRLDDVDEFEEIFGYKHTSGDLLEKAVYGLPELDGVLNGGSNREKIKKAVLVANPGCFATGVILGMAPMVKGGLFDIKAVYVDAKAGSTGGGRAPVLSSHFPEANENISTDRLGVHNQGREVENVLSNFYGADIGVTFVHHRVTISRGIFTTIYVPQEGLKTPEKLFERFEEFYRDEHFIRVYRDPRYITIKGVGRSNFVNMSVGLQGDTVIVLIVLDNLTKGAAGQAVQNMNLMFGFDERIGLEHAPIAP